MSKEYLEAMDRTRAEAIANWEKKKEQEATQELSNSGLATGSKEYNQKLTALTAKKIEQGAGEIKALDAEIYAEYGGSYEAAHKSMMSDFADTNSVHKIANKQHKPEFRKENEIQEDEQQKKSLAKEFNDTDKIDEIEAYMQRRRVAQRFRSNFNNHSKDKSQSQEH